MKFRQLEAFRAIMATGSMMSAAQVMHVTQPAVSRLITDLETHLSFRLFHRRRGALSPTAEGLRFYHNVEENFLGLERLENAATQIRAEGHSLKVAITHMLSTTLMPKVLKRFHKRFPECRVLVHSHRLEQVMLRMQNMSVDIAIASQMPKMRNNRRICIGSSAQVCVLPENHRLAKLEEVNAHDLNGENLLTILTDGPAYWDQPNDALRKANIQFASFIEVDTSFTAYAMIAEGLAIGIIEPFGAHLWESKGIITRPFVPEIRTNYFYTTLNKGGVRTDLEWFEKYLMEEAALLPGLSKP